MQLEVPQVGTLTVVPSQEFLGSPRLGRGFPPGPGGAQGRGSIENGRGCRSNWGS